MDPDCYREPGEPYCSSNKSLDLWGCDFRYRDQRLGSCDHDRNRALLAKLEVGVRCDCVSLKARGRRHCCIIVLARIRAANVVPGSNNINWLTKADRDRCVVRRVGAGGNGIGACHPWSKFHYWRSAARIWSSGLKVGSILVSIGTPVVLSEECARVTWCRRVCTALVTGCARSVSHKINDGGIACRAGTG